MGLFGFRSSWEKDLERHWAFMEHTFPGGVAKTMKKAFRGMNEAVACGDIQKELEVLNFVRETYVIPARGRLRRHDSDLDKVEELFKSIPQVIWNSHLPTTLNFEWLFRASEDDLQPKWLSFERENVDDDLSWNHDSPILIQVRSQRLIIDGLIYLIDDKTLVERVFDEAEFTESYRIVGDDWLVQVDLFHDEECEDPFDRRRQKKELDELRQTIEAFLGAVQDVQSTLKLIEDQKTFIRSAHEKQTKYAGSQVGDWLLTQRLGGGAFGDVWLGERTVAGDAALKQKAAVKVFANSSFQSSQQFQAEMASLAQLDHPNIAKLLDYPKTGNQFWFATSFAGKSSLGSAVAEHGRLGPSIMYSYALQLFAALAHAHRRNVVHGDVHPGNLVLTNDASGIVLVDFGLATVGSIRTQLALTNLAFRAPELLDENPAVTPKNDVYSAAITLATIALGRVPWKSENNAKLSREITSSPPNLSGLDPNLEAFLKPLLSREPNSRPSAEQVYQHLRQNGFSSW